MISKTNKQTKIIIIENNNLYMAYEMYLLILSDR